MFRKKLYKGIIWGIFVLVLLQVSLFSQDEAEKIAMKSPRFQTLQEILNSKENTSQKAEAIKESLKAMDERGLLQIWEEAYKEKQIEIAYIVGSEMIRRWEESPPSISFFIKEILNKKKNTDYRLALVSYLGSSKGKKFIKEGDKPNIAEIYFRIVVDKQENSKLRAESMLNLTVLQPNKKTFRTIINMLNSKEDIVKGYAAHCLKLLGDEEAIQPLLKSLENIVRRKNADEMADTTRRLMVALGRFKVKEAISLISEVADTTDNPDIFGSAVYSLGQIRSPEIILPMLKAWKKTERFRESKSLCDGSCWAAMRHNEDLVIDVLSGKIGGSIPAGIELISKMQEIRGVADEERAVGSLQNYLNSSDSNIRQLTVEALHNINTPKAKKLLQQRLKVEKEDKIIKMLQEFVPKTSNEEAEHEKASMTNKTIPPALPPKF